MKLIHNADELQQLLAHAPCSHPCRCSIGDCYAWASLTEDRWPANQLERLATMRNPDLHEPTFEEHHPNGTRYDSPQAPVAVSYFPYNRCDLWRCKQCQRHLLRYTEFGGYYVDHRVRTVSPDSEILD